MDDNTKISDKLKETLERAHVEIFKYHNIDRKLKIEIAGRYYKFYNKFYKRKIFNKTFMTYDDLKVCIPEEIEDNIILFEQEKIIEDFINSKENDYFVIRNFIYFVRFCKDLYDERLIKIMETFFNHEREDLRLLSNSCISILKIRDRKNKEKKLLQENDKDKI
ncbi:hypothetical protein COBT_004234, partial [Conglomerata obtusa]